MPDRSSLLNNSGDSSQFMVWGVVSVILHAAIFAGMFFMPELRFSDPQPRVITIDLSSMPSLEPPAKKKGSLPKASPAPSKPAAESGAPAEKEVATKAEPKAEVEKKPAAPQPEKESPPPPPKPEPKPEEVKKPKEVEKPKEDVISTKPKKEPEKPEKKEEKQPEPKDTDKQETSKDAKKDSESKDAKKTEAKEDAKESGKNVSDALARMRKKVALESAARKAAEGEGDGGEEGDPKGSEKGSIHGVEGGSEKGGASGTVADFYLYEIARYLGKNWVFANASSGPSSLEAHVILKILPSGELKEPPFFEKRSGNSFFDDSVYRTIMKSAPFPNFPKGIKEGYITAAYRFTPDGIK